MFNHQQIDSLDMRIGSCSPADAQPIGYPVAQVVKDIASQPDDR
jgi:hypothetical protein